MSLPLVLELQRLALDDNTSVVQLVRTAKLVAAKLKLPDAIDWIDHELNGYPDLQSLPKYRILRGECRAMNPFRGWIPAQLPDAEMDEMCAEARICQSLGSIEPLLSDDSDHALLPYPFELERILQKLFQEQTRFAIRLSKGHLAGIFDAVRNLTLNWSIELEQAGVRGENMSFTPNEQKEARPVTQQFFIQNAGVVGNVSDHANVANHQTVHGSLSVERVRDLVEQAKASLPALPQSVAAEASRVLDELTTESRQASPDVGKLRRALSSLKTICEGAAGNIVASGITAAVTALLTHAA
ncbi:MULTISPECIES: hypothetical protein [Ralstonia]|uniref:AbiTii domain-containing protein n=1 Tax=Ralstonia TaxID=48736 RepID=UPI000385AE51|nr:MULTISPECIES: hypothetical protein [Ralstonia]EPX96165.1 hypothetical protein C404_20110 [Ralstonia sp. AU12-08]